MAVRALADYAAEQLEEQATLAADLGPELPYRLEEVELYLFDELARADSDVDVLFDPALDGIEHEDDWRVVYGVLDLRYDQWLVSHDEAYRPHPRTWPESSSQSE